MPEEDLKSQISMEVYNFKYKKLWSVLHVMHSANQGLIILPMQGHLIIQQCLYNWDSSTIYILSIARMGVV